MPKPNTYVQLLQAQKAIKQLQYDNQDQVLPDLRAQIGGLKMAKKWKALGVAAALTACIAMTGCAGTGVGRDYSPKYPVLRYRNSEYNMDPYNREIPVQDGYILDEGNSYEVVETDSGYDLVLHFVKGDNENG